MLFQNNKKRLIITLVILIITYIFLIYFLEFIVRSKQTLCLFKLIFHKDCPGCGMTRAFYNFLLFNFKKGIEFNKKIIIVYPLIWGLYSNYVYKKIKIKESNYNGNKKNK